MSTITIPVLATGPTKHSRERANLQPEALIVYVDEREEEPKVELALLLSPRGNRSSPPKKIFISLPDHHSRQRLEGVLLQARLSVAVRSLYESTYGPLPDLSTPGGRALLRRRKLALGELQEDKRLREVLSVPGVSADDPIGAVYPDTEAHEPALREQGFRWQPEHYPVTGLTWILMQGEMAWASIHTSHEDSFIGMLYDNAGCLVKSIEDLPDGEPGARRIMPARLSVEQHLMVELGIE